MKARRRDQAENERIDEPVDTAVAHAESDDSHERLRKLRLMLGEATGSDGGLSSESGPRSRPSPEDSLPL